MEKCTLTIALADPSDPGAPVEFEQIEGWASGHMGVYRAHYPGEIDFVVMHVPSGFRLHTRVKTEDVRSLVAVLGPLLPAAGVLGQSPAVRMTAPERRALRDVFRKWLLFHGYGYKRLAVMSGEAEAQR